MRNAEKKMTELNLEERPMCYARSQPKTEGRNVALRHVMKDYHLAIFPWMLSEATNRLRDWEYK